MSTDTEPSITSNSEWGIRNEDCVDGLKKIADATVHLAFADPPFNIGYEYDEYDDRLDSEKYIAWCSQWMQELYRVLRPDGSFWLAIGDEYAAELKIEAQKCGFLPRSWVVWYYTFGVHCKNKFTRSHAHLFYFTKDAKKFYFDSAEIAVPSARQLVYADRRANPSGRTPDDTWTLRPQDCRDAFNANEDLWYFPRVNGTFKERAGFHGCQMPEQLLGRIIRSCSKPGDTVLDPFSGSATTLVVAKKLDRRFLGFELSVEYAARGTERLERTHVGDRLEGAEEPKVSAPSVEESQRKGKKKGGLKKGVSEEGFLPGFLEPLLAHDDSDKLMMVWTKASNGYCVDRVVLDPILNEDFQRECDRAKVDATPAERNRQLFRWRTQGKLEAPEMAFHETKLSWEQAEAYWFASEIAWRTLHDAYEQRSLDELFCDPRLAKEFDAIAARWVFGVRSFDLRWAALLLRRAAKTAEERLHQNNPATLPETNPPDAHLCVPVAKLFHEDLCNTNLPDTSAYYRVVSGNGLCWYAGETLSLSRRLSLQFSPHSIASWQGLVPDMKDLVIQWSSCPTALVSPLRTTLQSSTQAAVLNMVVLERD